MVYYFHMDIMAKLKETFQKVSTSALNNVMQTKSDSVIGIDIGTSAIKVVQIKKREGRAVLETYGAIALGPYADLPAGKVTNLDNEKLLPAITELLKASGVNTKETAFAIPSAASLIFIVDIPDRLSEKEYDSVIQTEARKFIPVPIAEVTLDWWVIPERDSETSGPEGLDETTSTPTSHKKEALVVAIHNDTLTRYKELVTSLELVDPVFEIEVFSSIRANFGHELSPVLIFDMGASKTKLSVIEHGVVRTFHVVNRGSHDISNSLATSLAIPFEKAEELKRSQGLTGIGGDQKAAEIMKASLDYVFMEANSVVLDYERKQNKIISKVVLTGGGVLLKGFVEEAKKNFSCDVVIGNPFAKIEAPVFLSKALESAGPEFGVALGIALRKLQ